MKKKDLRIIKGCKDLGVPFWQCPQFLFLLMGIVIGLSSLLVYFLGTRYIQNYYVIALIAIGTNLFLFVLSFFITQNFEKAIESSRMKTELTNIIIHQIRSPLTSLRWSLESLDIKEDVLNKNLKRMAELTDDLLMVTKIEEKDFALQKKEFFLNELVEEVLKNFSLRNFKTDFKEVRVKADYNQVRLVIENLIDNAIRYCSQGNIKIKVYQKNNQAIFEIKDEGVGIPERDQKHIFEKFFRSDNTLKNKTKGSGLGLYIVKKIIEKHKGKIWFQSEEGKGTTFYFSI